MVDSFNYNDIVKINELGKLLNNNFEKLFHIESINKDEKIYVYRIDNIVKGFLHIYDGIDVVDILNIIVEEQERTKGIGSKLIDYLIKNINKRIMLEVRSNNQEAINLYKKFNFKEINIRKNYYNGVDAIIMERK